ncbi:PadR family transcriptional regulator [Actinokineospora sp. UTMC 2448]|uniref:PadR family transcriptional regulator n=1 Tax=Actinokineospora sp. UTMC 2448 TaxID=2268449 RepID=UPI002164BE9F|nr:PadR family transcriptional regulator [Actinokineospora sp. UTMC 2448]UVS76870.1 transcriptional regulator, Acidobacterial, PadR-family [Actinokineospora sp. UTMC 2448]
MALEHAILVSLRERAGSGYELTRRFDKSIGFFWRATHQQIYRVLKRMLDEGWVTVEHVAQEGRPDKKVYSVSADGRDELARWLAEPGEPVELRTDLAVKIRGAGFGDPAAVVAEVRRHRRVHAERLAAYRAIEAADFPDGPAHTGQTLHQYLVLRGGIAAEEAFVAWCGEVLDAMEPS